MPNISRSKGNQTMKFGQLVECITKKLFFEKSCTKCGGETSPRHFSEKWKLSICLDQQFNIVCFYCMASWGLSKYIKTVENQLILGFFKNIKKCLELVTLPHFPHSIWKEYFSFYVLLIDQISLSGCLYLVRYWAYVYWNCL